MNANFLQSTFNNHYQKQLSHRYICNDHIIPILEKLPADFSCLEIGRSVKDEPIFSVRFGSGSLKILMWSQMHGNESTTTKAIFDLFSVISSNKNAFKSILQTCDITIIPILNPDGARVYTRVNANAIDLNRDAKDFSQPESKVLRQVFDTLKPDFCFNLHGQRTIFSVTNKNSATLSFLAPAEDKKRSVTKTRIVAMSIIANIYKYHNYQLEDQIGRYDDTYNDNCVGDTFQSLGVPTVLFEAGHFKNDYVREKTRQFIFESLCVALQEISKGIDTSVYKDYFKIPENEKFRYDVIIKNTSLNGEVTSIAIQYVEQLHKNKVQFIPQVVDLDIGSQYKGHFEIDAKGNTVLTHESKSLFQGYENDFVLINNEKYALKA
ncbi:M14 family zinc carboxypeptidase [Ichthyenterobacterium sp. W332]|uniref:M14 family zinc carboxypeptidase n=1 Tax=Microcosmobacter mediterraneus TaxID=3075607 RepID=A0ABU2YKY2_9FLAO|nr:M14 family zinc carboxypeptidase [Ichthyenterobacterium sp. W332]MDT0558717.1 M14 family zinc carboxypeptidase [Ichthyenterobacterium sp. W332]